MAKTSLPESELPKKPLREKYQRLYELVVEQLTDWIMDGTLKAGQRINPEEICRQLGVSRMPVRDALKILEENGLVNVVPYLGTTVASLTMEDITELYEMRMALEPLAAYHGVKRITDEEIQELIDVQNTLEDISRLDKEERDVKKIYQYNRLFHQKLYESSGMKRLCKTIEGIWDSIAYLRLRSVYNSNEYPDSMKKEHEAYLECIQNRDADKIRKLIHDNLKKHYNQLEKTYSNYCEKVNGREDSDE